MGKKLGEKRLSQLPQNKQITHTHTESLEVVFIAILKVKKNRYSLQNYKIIKIILFHQCTEIKRQIYR